MNQRILDTDLDCASETQIKVEVLVDHDSVELFYFDWYSITDLIFTEASNNGVRISSDIPGLWVQELRLEFLAKSML